MMWMGLVSAWGAVVVGLIFGGFAAFEATNGAAPAAVLATVIAAVLLVSGYRTLRRMSGGLRLLAGAWGVVVGLESPELLMLAGLITASVDPNISYSGALPALFWLRLMLFAVSLAGVALTVLHQERT